MKALIFCALFLASTSLFAAGPEGFVLWKGSDVKAADKELSGKMDEQKLALKPLGNYENHLIGIAYREASGVAELHETQTDILIVENGEATLTVGGTLVNPKTVKPNEVRGTSIDGGATHQVTAGDIMHIPAKTPHQLKLAPGTKLTYLVIKVDTK